MTTDQLIRRTLHRIKDEPDVQTKMIDDPNGRVFMIWSEKANLRVSKVRPAGSLAVELIIRQIVGEAFLNVSLDESMEDDSFLIELYGEIYHEADWKVKERFRQDILEYIGPIGE